MSLVLHFASLLRSLPLPISDPMQRSQPIQSSSIFEASSLSARASQRPRRGSSIIPPLHYLERMFAERKNVRGKGNRRGNERSCYVYELLIPFFEDPPRIDFQMYSTYIPPSSSPHLSVLPLPTTCLTQVLQLLQLLYRASLPLLVYPIFLSYLSLRLWRSHKILDCIQ